MNKKYKRAEKQRQILINEIERIYNTHEIAISNKKSTFAAIYRNELYCFERMKSVYNTYMSKTREKMNGIIDKINNA